MCCFVNIICIIIFLIFVFLIRYNCKLLKTPDLRYKEHASVSSSQSAGLTDGPPPQSHLDSSPFPPPPHPPLPHPPPEPTGQLGHCKQCKEQHHDSTSDPQPRGACVENFPSHSFQTVKPVASPIPMTVSTRMYIHVRTFPVTEV